MSSEVPGDPAGRPPSHRFHAQGLVGHAAPLRRVFKPGPHYSKCCLQPTELRDSTVVWRKPVRFPCTTNLENLVRCARFHNLLRHKSWDRQYS
jgi:hypothetical protein